MGFLAIFASLHQLVSRLCEFRAKAPTGREARYFCVQKYILLQTGVCWNPSFGFSLEMIYGLFLRIDLGRFLNSETGRNERSRRRIFRRIWFGLGFSFFPNLKEELITAFEVRVFIILSFD